jgi:hypothetical protein
LRLAVDVLPHVFVSSKVSNWTWKLYILHTYCFAVSFSYIYFYVWLNFLFAQYNLPD